MILDYEKDILDESKIDFDVEIKNNWKDIKIIYNNDTLKFKTPSMRVPFDVIEYQKTQKIDYAFCLSFNNKDFHDPFYEFVKDLEKKIKNKVFSTLEEKINIKLSEQDQEKISIDENNYTYRYKIKDNDNYSSNLNVKLMLDDNNEIATELITDENIDKIDNNNYNSIIKKGSFLECIINCTNLWIINDNIYITFSVSSIKEKLGI